MKKLSFISTIAFAFAILLSSNVNAQDFPKMDPSPMDVASFPNDYRVANKLVKIAYSRPQLKGRDIAKLAPNGKVWRTGANESAEITFYVDMKLGGKTIKAGTYSFATIPGEKEWTIIINSELNAWGAYFYKEANDVARLNVPVTAASDSLEEFAMVFTEADNGVHLNMGWGTVRVAVPFTK
ncbi:DUF2911 domain-containing protein [Flavobacteriaceae bacterium AU392]|nr:DUF2911 domain-containing protein [Flavobacteriaceae bacterium]RKM81296.1 DUF2911 domain-containing protein [Flavobacteriaceae bacterium AU392]